MISSVDEKTGPHSMTGNKMKKGHQEIINDLCLFSQALLTQFFQSSTTIYSSFPFFCCVFLRKESFEISFFSFLFCLHSRQKKDFQRIDVKGNKRGFTSVLSMHKTLYRSRTV